MTTSPVITPFPVFTDNDGTPLESGYIYVGVAGLDPKTNPKTVYTDIGLTNPIAQPIRTVNGYPVKTAGNIVSLFVDGLYSITVEDVNNVLLYTSLSEGVVSGAIDTGTGDITTRGKIDLPIDGTALNAPGSINFGEGVAGVLDAGMYFDGVDLQIQTKGVGAQDITLDSEVNINLNPTGGTIELNGNVPLVTATAVVSETVNSDVVTTDSLIMPDTDSAVFDGTTLTELLENTVFDSNCSERVIDHQGDIGNPTNFIFTKLSKHKLLRIALGGQEYSTADTINGNRINVTVGTIPLRTVYSGVAVDDDIFPGTFHTRANYGKGEDWFDISGEPDGDLTVAVADLAGGAQSRFYFQAFANAF